MSKKLVSTNYLSRRDFLKLGCLTGAAAGLALCGVAAAVSESDVAPVDFPSQTFGEKTMTNRILIAYASAFGSTAEVAVEIGKTLSARGISVDIRPIEKKPQLKGYQAVLIGSAVQYGKWLPQAVEFVKDQQGVLSELPVALFCVHIRNTADDEASRQACRAYLDEIRPLLPAADEAYFAGRFDRRGAALLLPGWLARFIPPIDSRNWKQIRAWAEQVPARLIPAPVS